MGKRGPQGLLRRERALERGMGGGRLHGSCRRKRPLKVDREARAAAGHLGPRQVLLKCLGLILLGSWQIQGRRGLG